MECASCHEDTDTVTVKVGPTATEEWCAICVEMTGMECALCRRVVDFRYSYLIVDGGDVPEVYVCRDDIQAWAAGLRPQPEMCCEPDHSWDAGYVHADDCAGPVER